MQVALRLRAAGKREGANQGETVPYVIALKTDASAEEIASGRAVNQSSGGKGLADRAYHPDEVSAEGGGLLDLHYYLTQQVHPVVSRLCQPIEGTDAAHIANYASASTRPSFTTEVVTATGGNEYDDDLLAPAAPSTTRMVRRVGVEAEKCAHPHDGDAVAAGGRAGALRPFDASARPSPSTRVGRSRGRRGVRHPSPPPRQLLDRARRRAAPRRRSRRRSAAPACRERNRTRVADVGRDRRRRDAGDGGVVERRDGHDLLPSGSADVARPSNDSKPSPWTVTAVPPTAGPPDGSTRRRDE